MGYPVSVKVVKRHGQSVLVEWLDEQQVLRRGYVPADCVEEGLCSSETLELGIPYGVPWSELIRLEASSEDLEKALYRAGVWTAEDAKRNPQAVLGAIQSVYRVDLAQVLSVARSYKE